MKKPATENMLRAWIMDSLVARSGKVLDSTVINEISLELIERMSEIIEDAKEDAINEIVY